MIMIIIIIDFVDGLVENDFRVNQKGGLIDVTRWKKNRRI